MFGNAVQIEEPGCPLSHGECFFLHKVVLCFGRIVLNGDLLDLSHVVEVASSLQSFPLGMTTGHHISHISFVLQVGNMKWCADPGPNPGIC